MKACFRTIGKINFLDIHGDINMSDAFGLEKQLKEKVAGGITNLAVNLTNTDFLNSYMITLFIGLYKRLTSLGGTFSIILGESNVKEVIRVSGIDTVVNTYRTEKEFLKLQGEK